MEILPWARTPSSSNACHIPVAWTRLWTTGDKLISQSTSSEPRAHFLIILPDTFRSFKHPFESVNNNVLSDIPILNITGVGDWKQKKFLRKLLQFEKVIKFLNQIEIEFCIIKFMKLMTYRCDWKSWIGVIWWELSFWRWHWSSILCWWCEAILELTINYYVVK